MSKELENTPKIGRPKGSVNTRNLEIFELAQEHGFNPMKVKMLLAMLKLEELGYTKTDIEQLSVQEKIEIQDRNTSDVLPYFYGKRKPVDSEGNDDNDPITAFIEALSGSK